jgi:hypothetical protein
MLAANERRSCKDTGIAADAAGVLGEAAVADVVGTVVSRPEEFQAMREMRPCPGWPLPHDNVQRFMLAGAAHRPLREGSAAGIRAGEHKTC